jgi:hypothetical protein
MESPDLVPCLTAIAEILSICGKRPDVSATAEKSLRELLAKVDPGSVDSHDKEPRSIRAEIDDHVRLRKRAGLPCTNPGTTTLRGFAPALARDCHVPLDPAILKRKETLMPWYEKHWELLREQLWVLIDNPLPDDDP